MENRSRGQSEKSKHNHKWVVYNTALCPSVIMVFCETCKEEGIIKDYSKAEWERAFNAPSENYVWEDDSRVQILNTNPLHIDMKGISNTVIELEKKAITELLKLTPLSGADLSKIKTNEEAQEFLERLHAEGYQIYAKEPEGTQLEKIWVLAGLDGKVIQEIKTKVELVVK